jgi:hypothetical protein
MTQYTAHIIETDQQVHAAAIGPFPNDKFGVYIGTYDEAPSGSKRPMILLTSDGVFDTPAEALEQGQLVIDQIRANGWTEQLENPDETTPTEKAAE